jgi:hypothetical protein
MTLKYVSAPQSGRSPKGVRLNLPAGTMSMASAPSGAAEIVRRDAQGNIGTQWAQFRRDGWREIKPIKTPSGGWLWQETGFKVAQPLGWIPRKR